jgi:hypothetical protein
MRPGRANKEILAYDSLLIPVQNPGHFILIVVQPHQHSIKVYDSLRPDYEADDEIAALQRYLIHVAGDRTEYHQWTVDRVAANDMLKQQGGVHCGIYVCMMAHCLIAGLPITLLTPDNIASCRQHIAQCLLNNQITPLTRHNVTLSTGNGSPTAATHSEESKGDDDDNSNLQTETHDHSSYSIFNPAFLNFPLLDPQYSWSPTVHPHIPTETHELRTPKLTAYEYDDLLRHSSSPQPDIQIYGTVAPRTDFLNLLQAEELPATIVNALFRAGLDSHQDTVFFPAEVTHEFSTGTQHRYQRLADTKDTLKPYVINFSINPVRYFSSDQAATTQLLSRIATRNRSTLQTVS